MSVFRGFIAVEVECSPSLLEFMRELKNAPAQLKIVEPKNVHLTLKFLGNTEEEIVPDLEKVMRQSVEGVSSFEVNLHGVGVFPNENYITVIWVGIEKGQELVSIAGKLDELLQSLGYKRERRPFSPHLTVARVKHVKDKDALVSLLKKYSEVEFGEINVDSIKLKKSVLTPKGPIYTTLKEVELG
ncbi:MAG: RNA 2',3'-cyclic phosphodiesterase [Thermoplasmata archaeon]|nr:RNA 2',3'-cyclic phosphodiesterase [Thermoplasmata archaeon]RLF27556.1 MAG: RNA 2',3'-cyclic phosphodiesterase [Thermoplasmata archaeon]